jgi:WD40 repeat protein/serine/threonine protein kinase
MAGLDGNSLELPGGSYALKKRLGQGQFGVVWQCEAPGGVPVAVKIIERTLKGKEADRELQALQVVKELRHPFLLSLQAFYSLENRLVIVLELADKSLRARLEECRQVGHAGMPPLELLRLFQEAAEALDFLHDHKVQHRDIKPDNLLLLKGHVKVADCGLARLVEEHSLQMASTVGTPAYMAPEVWKEGVHPNSDQYSLAVTYAELRLGNFPFLGNNIAKLVHAHLYEEPQLEGLDPQEQEVLRQALAKQPGQRFPRCTALAEALADALAGKEFPCPASARLVATAPGSPSPSDPLETPSADGANWRSLAPGPAPETASTSQDPHTGTATDHPGGAVWKEGVRPGADGGSGSRSARRLVLVLACLACILAAVALFWTGKNMFLPTEEDPTIIATNNDGVPDSNPKTKPKTAALVERNEEPKNLSEPAPDPREFLEKQIRALMPLTASATDRLKEPVDTRLVELRSLRKDPAFSQLARSLQERVAESILEFEDFLDYKNHFPKTSPDVAGVKTQDDLDRMDKLLTTLQPPRQYASVWVDLPLVSKRQDWAKDVQALRTAVATEEKLLNRLLQDGADLHLRGKKSVGRGWLERKTWLADVTDFFKKVPAKETSTRPVPGAASLTYQTVLAFDRVAQLHEDWVKTKADLDVLRRSIPEILALLPTTGHNSGGQCVALSADGKLVVTGSSDGTAIVWDSTSGNSLQKLRGDEALIRAVAMSGDGKQVVTGSSNGKAILWDSVTGKKLQTFDGHDGEVMSVALSGDGKKLVTASSDMTAILWDSATGKKVQTYWGHKHKVSSVALSGDGTQVVTGSYDDTAILWESATAKKLQTFAFQGKEEGVTSVALSTDGNQVVVGSFDRTAILWDTATGNKLQTFQGHGPGIGTNHTCVALSADGKQVVTGADDRLAILWDAATGKKLHTFQGQPDAVNGMALSADGKRVVTASIHQTAIMWDTATGNQLRTFQRHDNPVQSLALSADGKRVVGGSSYWPAVLWELATGMKVQTFQGHENPVTRVTLSADGMQVISGSHDKTAILWDSATGKKLQTFQGHEDTVSSVALSADGKQVVTGSYDKTAILWDSITGKKLQGLQGHKGWVSNVALSDDAKQAVTGSWDNTAILWELPSGRKIQTFQEKNSVWSVAMSGDGKQIVTGSVIGKAILWDSNTGEQLQTFQGHDKAVSSVALSGDGKQVVTGSDDRTAILWESATGNKLQVFQGHKDRVTSVALSPDGKQVWTGSEDGTTRLWDATTGKELCALMSLDGGKDWLVVSPDGYFDGSLDGRQMLAWREAGSLQVINDEAARQHFHRPGLLAQLWKVNVQK